MTIGGTTLRGGFASETFLAGSLGSFARLLGALESEGVEGVDTGAGAVGAAGAAVGVAETDSLT